MNDLPKLLETTRYQCSTPARPFTLFAELAAYSSKEWLVKDLLGAGEASVGFGQPGSGKSVLFEDMSLHIAAGLNWHGRYVKQGAVLLVALERRLLVERRAIAFRIEHEAANLPFAIIGGVHDFRDPRVASQFVAIGKQLEDVTAQKLELIQIDTLSRALCGGDENSPKDMGAIVNSTAILQEGTGAHVQWLHHMPVNGGDRMRGHGAVLGMADTTILVEKAATTRTATVVKANDSEEDSRIAFSLKSVVIGTNDAGEDTTAPVVVSEAAPGKAEAGPRLTKNQQTMFQLLHAAGARGLTKDEWNDKAREAGIGHSRRADLHDLREQLKGKGLIQEHANGWSVKQ